MNLDYDLSACLVNNPQSEFSIEDIESVLAVAVNENIDNLYYWVLGLHNGTFAFLYGDCCYHNDWSCTSSAESKIYNDPFLAASQGLGGTWNRYNTYTARNLASQVLNNYHTRKAPVVDYKEVEEAIVKNMGIDELLTQLDSEWKKFTKADDQVMNHLIDKLVRLGVYTETPAMKKYGYTYLQMVEGYGARWHEYKGILECPHCQADLRNIDSGPPFKREWGREEHDRIQDWWCPDCSGMIAQRG